MNQGLRDYQDQKKSIENHFDAFFSDELADRLPKEQRERILSAQFIYLRQPKPLVNLHKHQSLIDNQPTLNFLHLIIEI